ncbi:MAG: AEC family transporter [Desulfobacterales bacterium]
MMNIVTTIIPIFVIIILGWLARIYGFIRAEFISPANRLVFYLAIPAMVFRSISKTSLNGHFDAKVVGLASLSMCIVFGIAWILVKRAALPQSQRGTFVQNSFHGNIGYIGLAVSLYYLGREGFVRASILAGFLMILQNLLAVIALQLHAPHNSASKNRWRPALKIAGNPIILSALAGILVSLTALPVPLVLGRCLDILSGLAVPLALLIIGASLSFDMVQSKLKAVLSCGLLKLILLPAIGFILYRLFNVMPQAYLPGIILLASPTASVTYVMAKEMHGDSEFAVAAISLNTLLSAVTFTLWLSIVG